MMLIRLAFSYVVVDGFRPFSAAIVPKLCLEFFDMNLTCGQTTSFFIAGCSNQRNNSSSRRCGASPNECHDEEECVTAVRLMQY
jgi:hypothetical protein